MCIWNEYSLLLTLIKSIEKYSNNYNAHIMHYQHKNLVLYMLFFSKNLIKVGQNWFRRINLIRYVNKNRSSSRQRAMWWFQCILSHFLQWNKTIVLFLSCQKFSINGKGWELLTSRFRIIRTFDYFVQVYQTMLV